MNGIEGDHQRYRTVFGVMDTAFCVIEIVDDDPGQPADCRVVEVNTAFVVQTGITDAVGRRIRDLQPDHQAFWFETCRRIADVRVAERFEHHAEALGRVYEVHAFPIDAPDRHRVGVLFNDVTKRKRVEAQLRESEARLRAAFETVPVGVAVIDTQGRVVVGNEEYRRFLPNDVIPSRDPEGDRHWRAWHSDGRLLDKHEFPGARASRGERVVPGQEMLYTDDDGREIWTRVASVPVRDASGRIIAQSSVISDIDVAKRARDTLGESVARQRFLLKLSDVIGPLAGAELIQQAACRLVGEELDADRVGYGDAVGDDEFVVASGYRAAGGALTPGRYSRKDFRLAEREALDAGRTVVVSDIRAEPGITERQVAAYLAVDARSFVAVPLVKAGRLVAVFSVQRARAGPWTPLALSLIEEAAERTWAAVERAKAEAALRDSEELFRSFAETSTDTVWIANAADRRLEYVSPAFDRMGGEQRATVTTDLDRWFARIHPEDRERVLDLVPRLLAGEPYTTEYRVLPAANAAVRWIRESGFPIRDAAGRIVRAGGIAQDVTEEREARQHTAVLLAELQHRVRNILAVTRSIIKRTDDGTRSTEDYIHHLDGRLAALARVQVLLTRKANVGVAIEDIVREELLVQSAPDAQVSIAGPEVELAPRAAEVLTLAVHELATNAIKYGALFHAGAHLDIAWQVETRGDQPWLVFRWTETGVPIVDRVPRHEGFGRELISRRVPYELRGQGTFELRPGGLASRIELPLLAGFSILQTSGVGA